MVDNDRLSNRQPSSVSRTWWSKTTSHIEDNVVIGDDMDDDTEHYVDGVLSYMSSSSSSLWHTFSARSRSVCQC